MILKIFGGYFSHGRARCAGALRLVSVIERAIDGVHRQAAAVTLGGTMWYRDLIGALTAELLRRCATTCDRKGDQGSLAAAAGNDGALQ